MLADEKRKLTLQIQLLADTTQANLQFKSALEQFLSVYEHFQDIAKKLSLDIQTLEPEWMKDIFLLRENLQIESLQWISEDIAPEHIRTTLQTQRDNYLNLSSQHQQRQQQSLLLTQQKQLLEQEKISLSQKKTLLQQQIKSIDTSQFQQIQQQKSLLQEQIQMLMNKQDF